MRRARTALGAAAILLALTLALSATPLARRLEARLSQPTAPESAIGSAKLRRHLVRSGRLALAPAPDSPDCDGAALAARPLAPAAMPSSVTRPADWRPEGAPLVSLWLAPCQIERLHGRPFERGRTTEEVGWISIFDRGGLRFASAVGVRVHGGDSRKQKRHSYRVVFRSSLGAEALPTGTLFAPSVGAVSRLVLDRNRAFDRSGARWHFVDAITFDVAQRLGAETPPAAPILFSLAGEALEPRTAIERIDQRALRRRFGHDNLDLLRAKGDSSGPEQVPIAEELERVRALPAPLTIDVVSQSYDLDALDAHVVAGVVNGTGDFFQSVQLRDRRGEWAGGRWSWVAWDMDLSFFDPRRMTRFGSERDALRSYLSLSETRHTASPMRLLFRRLAGESPAYRRRLAARIERALDREITPEFVADLAMRYRTLGAASGIDTGYLDDLESYFARRPAELRLQLAELTDP